MRANKAKEHLKWFERLNSLSDDIAEDPLKPCLWVDDIPPSINMRGLEYITARLRLRQHIEAHQGAHGQHFARVNAFIGPLCASAREREQDARDRDEDFDEDREIEMLCSAKCTHDDPEWIRADKVVAEYARLLRVVIGTWFIALSCVPLLCDIVPLMMIEPQEDHKVVPSIAIEPALPHETISRAKVAPQPAAVPLSRMSLAEAALLGASELDVVNKSLMIHTRPIELPIVADGAGTSASATTTTAPRTFARREDRYRARMKAIQLGQPVPAGCEKREQHSKYATPEERAAANAAKCRKWRAKSKI